MASQPAPAQPPGAALTYRTAPTAAAALEQWLQANPQARPVHTQPWDVSCSELYRDDRWQPVFAAMRAQAPVNKVVGTPYGDFWNVTTVKAIQHVEALPELFSSSYEQGGITIGERPDNFDDAFVLPMFIAMDRPQHTGQRRAVAPAFAPAEMERLSGDIRRRTGEVLDALPWGERFDWVDRVSIELTTGMLALLFGFPWRDRRLLTFWSDWAGDVELGLIADLMHQRHEILLEMGHCFQRLWHERVDAPPAPDLISMMSHSEAMKDMGFHEFIGNLVLLIVGGNDTTRNTMSGIVHALDAFPGERARLEADPGLIPNAVQECLRFVTPLAHMRRTATADADLFGQAIRKGDKVVLWYISANRDETVFADPDVLDVGRENARRHLSFGHGIHRCVGARLAELQLRILLEEMHARRMRVVVAGRVERVRANFVHGFRTLEVALERF